jgi:hypothetical protein
MARYASRLHKKLASTASDVPTQASERRRGEPQPSGIADIETLIKKGHDPIHAAYVSMQQLSSLFAEGVGQLSEMKAWSRSVEKAEDEYMPEGPPISPLTRSYFWMWALYDLRIGKSTDTLAYCQIAANDLIQMNSHQLEALRNLEGSRMGIYEHIGFEGPHIRLRELITNDCLICHCTSGYRGKEGELWYVRLAPPLEPKLATYWVSMTTPYILLNSTKSDWISFLKRAMVQIKGPNERTRLHSLLKYGPTPNYWHEFVFTAYHHHQFEAVFLAGIPNVKASLPHA